MRRSAVFALTAALALAALGATAGFAGGSSRRSARRARTAAVALDEARAQQIGTDAYRYGFPLMEFMRLAREQTSVTVPNSVSDAPLNQLGNGRQLANVHHQVIVQPNNDTLYSMGHLDLARGPLVLHVPEVPHHRYYSFELMDPYTNVFAYVGTRATGDGAGSFAIVGPRFHGRLPRGLRRIRSRYRRAWLVGRTLLYGPRDLPEVHRIQDGYRLMPLSKYVRFGLSWRPPRPRRIVRRARKLTEPRGIAFFDALGSALAQNPPPRRDAPILRELRTVGIGPGLHPSREHLSAAILAGLTAAANAGPADLQSLRTQVATKSVLARHGWFVPPRDTGDYGTDYDFRAVVALAGIAANRPAEAMYVIGVTDSGLSFLDGGHDYVIHFPAGQLPPARYFWSLTMYDESFYLVPNAINRYELGNRSRGLKRNPDGSLDVYLQHAPPPGHRSNWLPAPAAGRFEVTLRLYGPRARALRGTYTYPPIIRTG